MKKIFFATLFACVLSGVSAQDIVLPKPVTTGGMPLMEALSKRSSTREFSSERLSNQTLSNLLWAAWGYNRSDKRTAPSGNDKQEVDVYVVLQTGAYRYDAKANKLILVNTGDFRKSVGKQDFVYTAPVNLVFVGNKDKGADGSITSAFIAENVYLFCASESLGVVVRGYFDATEVSKALKLNANQVPVLTQTIGKLIIR